MSIEEIKSQLKETYTLYIGIEYLKDRKEIISELILAHNDKEAVENVKSALVYMAEKGYLVGSSSYEYALSDPKGKIIPVEE
jgi:hypothetical protein